MISCDIPNDIRLCLGDISSITRPDQGLASEVVIVASEGKRFILKHSTGKFASWLRYEHQVLLALEQTAVPTARVRQFFDLEATDTGDCWLLIDYIPGEQLTPKLSRSDLTQDDRHELFRACGVALATVHAVPPPACLADCANDWLDTLICMARKAQDEYALVFDKDISETEARHEALLRIERMRPSVESYTLIHGDCSTNHPLFDGLQMTGLIDWGCAAIGDPRYDIAQVLCVAPEWATTEMNDDVMAFFEGYGTPPVPLEIIRYYQDLYEMGGQGCTWKQAHGMGLQACAQ